MSSVIQTFFMLFKADSKNLTSALDDIDKKTKKMKENLSSADLATQKLEKSFKNLAKQLTKPLVAALSIGAFVVGIKSAIEYSQHIQGISETLGIAVDDVDAWSKAIARSGGSQTSFEDAAQNINQLKTASESLGQNSSPVSKYFQSLGISLLDASGKAKSTTDILLTLSDSLSKIETSKAIAIGQKIGIDKETVLFLSKGREQVDLFIRKQKELGVINKQSAETIKKFNDSILEMKSNFTDIFSNIANRVIPFLNNVIEGFNNVFNFLSKHEVFVKTTLIGIASVVSAIVVPAFVRWAAATIAATWPIIAIGAAAIAVIGVIALLTEDIVYFFQGHDSLIGRAMKKWPEFAKTIKEVAQIIKDTFNDIVIIIKASVDELAAIIRLAVGLFTDPIKAVREFAAANKEIGSNLGELKITKRIESNINQSVANGGAVNSSITPNYQSNLQKRLGTANEQMDRANLFSMNNYLPSRRIIPESSSVNKSTELKIDTINIETQATDAAGISNQISTSLKNELSNTISMWDDGVKS